MKGTLFDCGFSVTPTCTKSRRVEGRSSDGAGYYHSITCTSTGNAPSRRSGSGSEHIGKGEDISDDDEDRHEMTRPFRLSDALGKDVVCVVDEDVHDADDHHNDPKKEESKGSEKSTFSSVISVLSTSSEVAISVEKEAEKEHLEYHPFFSQERSAEMPISKFFSPTAGSSSLCTEKEASVETTSSSSTWLIQLLPDDQKWRDFLAPITSDTWKNKQFFRIEIFLLEQLQAGKIVYPPSQYIFEAFRVTPFESVKVILLGQDPYHEPNQAHGLSFSVSPGVTVPPSLRNIYQELSHDIPGFEIPSHGYLLHWARQGVLLLNATLTVNRAQANSHAQCGWGEFTNAVIERLSKYHPERLVFLLWGKFAEKKKTLINTTKHTVLINCHPSPLSAHRGWFGCRCFSRCNDSLEKMGRKPIDWKLPLTV